MKKEVDKIKDDVETKIQDTVSSGKFKSSVPMAAPIVNQTVVSSALGGEVDLMKSSQRDLS